jgi:hypothetical protein
MCLLTLISLLSSNLFHHLRRDFSSRKRKTDPHKHIPKHNPSLQLPIEIFQTISEGRSVSDSYPATWEVLHQHRTILEELFLSLHDNVRSTRGSKHDYQTNGRVSCLGNTWWLMFHQPTVPWPCVVDVHGEKFLLEHNYQ